MLRAGVRSPPIFELAPYMGTSVDMIDRTYGHLAKGAEATARAKLDEAYARRLGQESATDEAGETGGSAATPLES